MILWSRLPVQLFQKINFYLLPSESTKTQRVCRNWNKDLNELFWKQVLINYGYPFIPDFYSKEQLFSHRADVSFLKRVVGMSDEELSYYHEIGNLKKTAGKTSNASSKE